MKLSNNLSPEQLLQQSQSLQQAGRFEEAALGFEKLQKLYPEFPPILNSLGIVYLQLGKYKDGCKLLEKSLSIDPKQSMVFYNLGRAHQNQSKLNDAAIAYKRAIKLDPSFIDAHDNLGMLLYTTGQFEEALKSFESIVKIKPELASGHNGLGISLYALGRYEEALSSLNNALAINQQHPQIFNNLGLVLHKFNQLEDAIKHYNHALQLNPDYADAYSNRGLTLQALKRTDEAEQDFDHCLALNPKHADAQWNKALIKISLGEYEEGWELYEWRWKSFSKKWARHYEKPLWLGEESLKGRSILIYPEQGYGDFIQFYRYIPKLQALGARIILETPAPLISLITESSTEVEIVESGRKLPKFDFQCPIMSLPLAFKTNLNSIPNKFPYVKAGPEKIKAWQEKLGVKTKKRIGLAWSGSKEHKNDHNRSIALAQLSSLLKMPFEFHSLQKEIKGADLDSFENSAIRNHQDDISDFSDTAALIENMDLVITVDTAIAHLAGSLNKPFFLLLPFHADYRWMLDRSDSPWYVTGKLFRQNQVGDWGAMIYDLKHHL